MIRRLLPKGKYLLLLYILLLLMVCLSPFWLWAIKPTAPLNVLIMDKTVPDETFREHKGLVWLLNNEKYVKTNHENYSIRNDYFGFIPKGNNQYKIKELPQKLDQYDLIYFTDLYGVYKKEFYGSNFKGQRSELLYGGLTTQEVERIQNYLFHHKGKTLIAEFNTFASPTNEKARIEISKLLNISWSGWIGRYFSDLSSEEVPIWMKEQYKGNWNFKGAGIVFVNEADFIYVVEGKELTTTGGVPILLTQYGKNIFKDNLNSNYQYWFDIVNAKHENEVLANYHLPVNKRIKKTLLTLGIPATFPAINRYQNGKYTAYYFSGDFADEQEVPSIYQTRGISLWRKNISATDTFFWKTYFPMMQQILKNSIQQGKSRGKGE